jgi:hypothetical protein
MTESPPSKEARRILGRNLEDAREEQPPKEVVSERAIPTSGGKGASE